MAGLLRSIIGQSMDSKPDGDGPTYPQHVRVRRIGGWVPHDPTVLSDYLKDLIDTAKSRKKELAPPIKEFQSQIFDNPSLYMFFTKMLTETPITQRYKNIPSVHPKIADISSLFEVINDQIQSPIAYDDALPVGCPLSVVLDWPMSTNAGFSVLARDDVNDGFEKILKFWSEYLQSPESLETVTTNPGGWLSVEALNDPFCPGLHNFAQTYICDPDHPHYGFTSWDDFFTRKFRPGMRPVAYPDDDCWIGSATESTPFTIQTDIQLYNTFWTKGQNYSLAHMLGDAELAERFVGGMVYQSFLSADGYHRWHAPVSGRYVGEPRIIRGSYFSRVPPASFDPKLGQWDNDLDTDYDCHVYFSSIATRCVMLIEADNPAIGQMAVIMVGVAEVSSCDYTADLINFKRGDEIGRFHHGGSECCLIFRAGVKIDFVPEALPNEKTQSPNLVNSALGRV